MQARAASAAAALALLGAPLAAGGADDLSVRRGAFRSRLVLTGELVAESAVHVVVPNANIWPVQIRWLAEDGTEVDAGETIVDFDNSQLASNLEQLEQASIEAANSLTSLEAEVRSQELEADFDLETKRADLDKARIDAAVPPELLSQKEYEERQLALRRKQLDHDEALRALTLERAAGEARVDKQRIALEKARMEETRARDGIGLLSIGAPRSGVLLVAENREEGRPFQTGDTTWPGTNIASLPELSSMIAEARLYDVDDGRIELGTSVVATVDAFPDERWSGKVTAIDSVAAQMSRVSLRRAFRVKIRLDDLDVERMRPGMSVRAVLEAGRDDVLLVPRAALRWSEIDGALRAEARRERGGWVEVDLGACNPRECVVLAGLDEGERLSIEPPEPTP